MQKHETKLPRNVLEKINTVLEFHGTSLKELTEQSESKSHPSKKYLSVTDAEEYTSVSRWTIHRAAKAGILPVIKLSDAKSGKVLIEKSALDNWLQSKQRRV